MKAKIRKDRKHTEIIKNSALELHKILNICISARVLFEIYCGLTSNTSELLSDRVTYYKNKIQNDLEELRSVHNSLQNLDFPYSKKHNDLLFSISMSIWEIGDQLTEDSKSFSRTSFSVGIIKFIARATDISGISNEIFYNGKTTSTENTMTRLGYFVLYNCENQLRQIAEQSTKYYVEEGKESFNGDKLTLYVLSTLGASCMILILLFFIPYIMKVQRNILKAFDHISEISHREIKKILDVCYVFKNEIEAPAKKLTAIFKKEDFSVTTDQIEREEREKRVRQKKHKSTTEMIRKLHKRTRKEYEEEEEKLKSNNGDENGGNENYEKKYLVIMEERKIEAKKKIFSAITNSKRKGYILRLAILLAFFFIFLITDILLLRIYFREGSNSFDILQLFSVREYTLKTTVLFYREDLILHDSVQFKSILLC